MAHECHHDCGTVSSVTQTLDEMDFERGIWSAALDGDCGRVKRLLEEKKGDPDERDGAGYTALHYAARAGHVDTCRFLLRAGASVNAATRAGQATALHRAALAGREEVVRLLLDSNAEIRLVDGDGRTALQRAREAGHGRVVHVLVQAEATATDGSGASPSD